MKEGTAYSSDNRECNVQPSESSSALLRFLASSVLRLPTLRHSCTRTAIENKRCYQDQTGASHIRSMSQRKTHLRNMLLQAPLGPAGSKKLYYADSPPRAFPPTTCSFLTPLSLAIRPASSLFSNCSISSRHLLPSLFLPNPLRHLKNRTPRAPIQIAQPQRCRRQVRPVRFALRVANNIDQEPDLLLARHGHAADL